MADFGEGYGRCDDCGGGAYAMLPGRQQVCRDCHSDRANFIARNKWARANVLSHFSESFGLQYRVHWDEATLKEWEARAPEREQKRRIVESNLAAYERGEFPGDHSLVRGIYDGVSR